MKGQSRPWHRDDRPRVWGLIALCAILVFVTFVATLVLVEYAVMP